MNLIPRKGHCFFERGKTNWLRKIQIWKKGPRFGFIQNSRLSLKQRMQIHLC
ncbi:hypothetical protein OIU84_026961, partial [Salix udensis]